MIGQSPLFSVSDFVAVLNQTLEVTYPSVDIVGELANFRVSKNKWVYFDLIDEHSSVKFFGTVYMLPGPLEDGMMLKVHGNPRMHPQFGFSINIATILPVGEGTIVRASKLLEVKLRAEGLFEDTRKRTILYPPARIGLITSAESAAYHDFVKVINARWVGTEIVHSDVFVQGELAPQQIVTAIDRLNQHPVALEALVITRGGGSADDLAVFNTEQVVRAIAASRVPTVVAIGHEADISLAELAADVRASTPSNAAELLVPDKKHELSRLMLINSNLSSTAADIINSHKKDIESKTYELVTLIGYQLSNINGVLAGKKALLEALNPTKILDRGYAIVKLGEKVIKSGRRLKQEQIIDIEMTDALVRTKISRVVLK